MADEEKVSMDVQASINQQRVLTRDDELRLFALQTATKDRFNFDKTTAEELRARSLADARAYYEFLTEGASKKADVDA